MTTSARDNILNRLRNSPKEVTPGANKTVKDKTPDHAMMIQRFCQMITAVHGEVHQTTQEDWPDVLKTLIKKKEIRSLLVAPQTKTGQQFIERCLIEQGPDNIELIYADKPVEEYKKQLFDEIEASLTDCRGAIAETGTLVIWPSKQEPRTMSLVPPVHFVLLNSQQITHTWAQLIAAEQWATKMPTNALLVSGPSKTADIQQTLAYGAHGPKELVILMI